VSVVLVSSDMLVSSRLRSTAEQAGVALGIALSSSELASRLRSDTRLVVFDLSQPALKLPEAVAAVRAAAPQAKILAFGPHVEEGLLAAARSAGCDDVLTNGQFHREQSAILASYGADGR
jgi:DNA-binding NarL/FixJ family response regulator